MTVSNEFTAVPHEFDGKRALVTGGTKGIEPRDCARPVRGSSPRLAGSPVILWMQIYS